MEYILGKKVSYWSSLKRKWVVGTIVRINTFHTMYEIDIGEKIVDVHKSDLWPPQMAD